jgi:hypothetical protein
MAAKPRDPGGRALDLLFFEPKVAGYVGVGFFRFLFSKTPKLEVVLWKSVEENYCERQRKSGKSFYLRNAPMNLGTCLEKLGYSALDDAQRL